MDNTHNSPITNFLSCAVFVSLALAIAIDENLLGNLTPLLLLLLCVFSARSMRPGLINNPLLYAFAGFLLYVFCSWFWALNTDAASSRLIKLGLLLLPTTILLMNTRPSFSGRWHDYLIYPYMLAVIVFALHAMFDFTLLSLIGGSTIKKPFDPLDLNSIAIASAVLLWPVLAVLTKTYSCKSWQFSVLIITVFATQFFAVTDAAALSLVSGLAGFYLFYKQQTWLLKAAIIISMVLVVFGSSWIYKSLPVENFQIQSDSKILQKVLEPSHLHRLEIWDRSSKLFFDYPLFGRGITGSYHLPVTSEPSKTIPGLSRSEFLYPHNLFLQLLIDFGLVGLLLFLWFLNELINWIRKQATQIRSYAGASLCSILVVYYFGFPLWRSWWIVLILTVALVFYLLSKEELNKKFNELN